MNILYPENAIKNFTDEDIVIDEDKIKGYEYLCSHLNDRSREIIELYFKEGLTYQEIGDKYRLTKERVRTIIEDASEFLKNPIRNGYMKYGYETWQKQAPEEIKKMMETSLDALDINSLVKYRILKHYKTIEEINTKIKKPEYSRGKRRKWHEKVQSIGSIKAKAIETQIITLEQIVNSEENVNAFLNL